MSESGEGSVPTSTAKTRENRSAASGEESISVLELVSVILRYRWLVAAVMIAGGGLALAATVLQPRQYTAHGSFLAQAGEGASLTGAAALAGQLGISLPSAEFGRSPEFYVELLTSREILNPLAQDTFTIREPQSDFPSRVTLATLLDVESLPPAVRDVEVVNWLREEAIEAGADRNTGVVSFRVTTPWAPVSDRVAHRVVTAINEFNLEQRQTQAGLQRAFVEERLGQARLELMEAEEELKRFLERNRAFENSPELVFEYDRLQRKVALRQQLVASLQQSYEEARIAEVRNLPAITIIERPQILFPLGDSKGTIRNAALGVLFGGALGMLLAFGREVLRRSRRYGDPDYLELRSLWLDMVEGLPTPLKRLLTGSG